MKICCLYGEIIQALKSQPNLLQILYYQEEELLAVQMITDFRIIYLRVIWVLPILNKYFSDMEYDLEVKDDDLGSGRKIIVISTSSK